MEPVAAQEKINFFTSGRINNEDCIKGKSSHPAKYVNSHDYFLNQAMDKRGSTGKKVLFVIDTLQLGGAEQSLLVNAIRFQKIIPVICHVYKGDSLRPRFVEKNIKVYSLNISKKYGFSHAGKLLSGIVKDEKPDLMVAYLTRSELLTRLVGKWHHVPVIGTFISDLYGKTYNQSLSWKAKRLVYLFKTLNRLTQHFCAGFIANSNAIKDVSLKQFSIPEYKMKVISRGRDSSKFKTRRFEKSLPVTSINFVNVGRLIPVKGQKELIIGFKTFLEFHSDATLTIIGEGPARKELTDIINENNLQSKVFLLGMRNDVPDLIPAFDCFIFPSFSEGFSGAIVEAMFAGLPVLASDILQNKEAITHFQTGYLFQKESIEEITNAMLWFKNNLSQAYLLAARAYEHAKNNFELETTVRQFEDYLLDKINEHRKFLPS